MLYNFQFMLGKEFSTCIKNFVSTFFAPVAITFRSFVQIEIINAKSNQNVKRF